MTYADFLDKVNTLLTQEVNRKGATEFVAALITQGIVNLMHSVDAYAVGRQSTYQPSDFSVDRFASYGDLPSGCKPRELYLTRSKVADISLVSPSTDYITTSSAHGITAASTDDEVETGYIAVGTGSIPGGITERRAYFLCPVSDTVITLHTRAADAITGENPVDITSAGSGVLALVYAEDRRQMDPVDWEDRHSLILGDVCMNNDMPKVCIEPNGSRFYVYPVIEELDSNGFTHAVELEWDGVGVDWEPGDSVPFIESDAATVADYVRSRMERTVKRDLPMASSYDGTSRDGRAIAYIEAAERTRTKRS